MRLWLLNIGDVTEADAAGLARGFPGRMARCARYRQTGDRLRCLGAALLLRAALGVEEESALRYGAQGKPYLPGGPEFNLSHAGDWVALAADDAPLGLDLEPLGRAQPAVARRWFTEAERRWLEEDPAGRFARVWTWKEAVGKATGRGLGLDPSRFEVLPLLRGAPLELEGQTWYPAPLGPAGLPQGYAFALCAARLAEGVEVRRLR